MDEVELGMFEVFYQSNVGVDYAAFRAEDEAHAVELFRKFYPDEKICEVEYRGVAF